MDFVDSLVTAAAEARLARLTVIFTPDKACWVSLPPPLIGRLLDGGAPMPLALDVSVVGGGGGETAPSRSQRFFVAWGGGATPGGGAPFLGVPAALAALLGVEEGATVDVRPLLLPGGDSDGNDLAPPSPPPRATRVCVTPASADDWEVVQLQAGILEERLLAEQVGLVSVGAAFPVWIPHAGAPLTLVAKDIEPKGLPVALLGPGCEVVVAPVERRKEIERSDGDGASSPLTSGVVSWLRVLPRAAEAAAEEAGARFAAASLRILPLIPPTLPSDEGGNDVEATGSSFPALPGGKRLATRASTTVWAPRSSVQALFPDRSSPSPPAVVALSSDLSARSPKIFVSLRAADDDDDDEIDDEQEQGDATASSPRENGLGSKKKASSSSFPLAPGHLSVPQAAARAAGTRPGRRAVLRPASPPPSAGGGDPPSLVILRPDRAAVDFRGAGGGGEGSSGSDQQQQGHPVLSALSSASPRELSSLFSAWIAAQAKAAGGPSAAVVCDGAVVRLTLVDDDVDDSSPSSSLDFAIELRWAAGNRKPGTPVLLKAELFLSSSPSGGVRVELGATAEMPPPAFDVVPSLRRRPWPEAQPLPPFGSAWTRKHLSAIVQSPLLRAPLDFRARRAAATAAAASLSSPRGGGGLVVTGARAGGGKTALAAAAARAFARDPSCCASVVRVACRELVAAGEEDNGGGVEGTIVGGPAAARAALASALRDACDSAPSLLVLDDVDAFGSSAGEEGADSSASSSLGGALAAWLSRALKATLLPSSGAGGNAPLASPPISVLATASDANAIPPCLRQPGLLTDVYSLPPLGPAERLSLLRGALRARGVPRVSAAGIALAAGEPTEGCDAADVAALAERAIHAAVSRSLRRSSPSSSSSPALMAGSAAAVRVCRGDFEEAARGFSPASAWAASAADSSSSSSSMPRGWEDVGAMDSAREALEEALSLPLAAARLIVAAASDKKKGKKKTSTSATKKKETPPSSAPPLRLRTGVLLFGPPGCGKTHIARAAVAAAGARCISVKGPELLDKYIGASEAAVRAVFARARAASPCVLFFDEFDSLAPARGADSTGVTDRVVNALLTELDGAEGGLEGVSVVAASSRPDLIDAALLRPGRLDRAVYCGPPATLEERESVLVAASRRHVLEEGKEKEVPLRELAEMTEGFSGADLSALLSEAALLAAREAVEIAEERRKERLSEKEKRKKGKKAVGSDEEEDEDDDNDVDLDPSPLSSSGPPPITRAHLLAALSAARPSLPRSELAAMEERYAAFRGAPKRPAPRGPAKGAHEAGWSEGTRVTLK